MDATDMNTVRRIPLFLGAAAGASLVILNVVTATFYLLWMGADQWLVNRSESGGGFDPVNFLRTLMLLGSPHMPPCFRSWSWM